MVVTECSFLAQYKIMCWYFSAFNNILKYFLERLNESSIVKLFFISMVDSML